MKKKLLFASFGVLASFQISSAQAALSSSALLAFDAGSVNCVSGVCTGTTGSYFTIDMNGDGVFSAYESIGISPGSDGGLLVGQSQLASNSHSGYPDGSEVAPLDSPWSFLGNTGMHQTTTPVTILGDDGMGNVELDFSGFGAIWNGVASFDLGVGVTGDPGIATVTCAIDCATGDSFTLEYIALLPNGDPTFGGGVGWKFYLEGTVSAVPVPAAVWLFGSGLLGLLGVARRRKELA